MWAPRLDRKQVRGQLDKVLLTDADLDAFCLDFFPQVHQRFSAGMDRTAEVNLLLQLVPDPGDIARHLRQPDPATKGSRAHGVLLWGLLAGMAVLAALGLGAWHLWPAAGVRDTRPEAYEKEHSTVTRHPAPVPAAAGVNSDNAMVASPDAQMRNRSTSPAPQGQPVNSDNRIEGSPGAQMTNEVEVHR